MDEKKRVSIDRFLNPKSIAVVGATENPGYGRSFMNNFLPAGPKAEFYPVNPKYPELRGVRCYPSVRAIVQPVDLAIIIVNAKYVEQTIEDCVASGVGSCLIISAGFSELDKVHGKDRELRLRQIAHDSGMRMVGPNTIGAANVKLNLWMHAHGGGTLNAEHFPFGKAAIISQSGAAGFGPLFSAARDRGVGLKYIVTTGNEADLEICDFIEFMLEDGEVDSIAVLIEGIKDGARFLSLAGRALELRKKLILMKLGESSVGERAAAGHTASLTGDMVVFNAMVKQYGMIKAEDYDELVEYTRITRRPHQLKGKRLCAISHSGGISGFLGDQLSKNGFEIPVFSAATQAGINEHLKGFGSPKNPLDLTSPMSRPCFSDMMKAVVDNENIDGYVFATHYYAADKVELLTNAMAQLKGKPHYLVWTGSFASPAIQAVKDASIPLSLSIQKFSKMLWNAYTANLVKARPKAAAAKPCSTITTHTAGYMDEAAAKALAASFGIAVPKNVVLGDAAPTEVNIPFAGPYAVKIVSDTIIHKTDVGGVVLNVAGLDDVAEACRRVRENTNEMKNQIKGVMVEQMCPPGLDMIVGVRKDAQFGPVLVVGLGGIHTELFKMTSCRLLPLIRSDAEEMLAEIPGLTSLLAGYRGQPALDREALIAALLQISGIAHDNRDRIELFEINPLRVLPAGDGARALDCVIKLSE